MQTTLPHSTTKKTTRQNFNIRFMAMHSAMAAEAPAHQPKLPSPRNNSQGKRALSQRWVQLVGSKSRNPHGLRQIRRLAEPKKYKLCAITSTYSKCAGLHLAKLTHPASWLGHESRQGPYVGCLGWVLRATSRYEKNGNSVFLRFLKIGISVC